MNSFKSFSRLQTILFIAFLVAAGFTASLAYASVRDLVIAWRIPGLGDRDSFIPQDTPTPMPLPALIAQAINGDIDATKPIQSSRGPGSRPWDGSSRITILLMGLDYRDWVNGQGPSRTDTMILFTIDPETKSMGMLSIPRDLWVAIPGHEYAKINTAYWLGEAEGLPGGGAGLAMATVEQLLGVTIDYYVQVDFGAFVKFVDEIGGIKIEIPYPIEIDPIEPGNHKTLKPGIQTLPGDEALAYARARNTIGGDFDRAQRQQQVIMAIRNRLLNFQLLPKLVLKVPILYQELSSGIFTNMTLEQVLRISLLVDQVPDENIRQGVIGADYVTFGVSPDGQYILTPLPDKIRVLRNEIFSSPESFSPVVEERSLEELADEEAAEIAVLNGTSVPGLAAQTTLFLKNQGLEVSITDNAEILYSSTTIIDYTGNPYTLELLTSLMGIDPNAIFLSYDPKNEVDIELNLGADWVDSENIN